MTGTSHGSTLTQMYAVTRRKILEVWLIVRLATQIHPCVLIFSELIHFSILPGQHWKCHFSESIKLSSRSGCFNKLNQGRKNGIRLSRKRVAALQEITHLGGVMSWIKISLFRDIIKSPTEIPLQNPWKIHDVTTAASYLLAISFHCRLDNGHLTHTAIPDDITLFSWHSVKQKLQWLMHQRFYACLNKTYSNNQTHTRNYWKAQLR